jgi:hypothetical protein
VKNAELFQSNQKKKYCKENLLSNYQTMSGQRKFNHHATDRARDSRTRPVSTVKVFNFGSHGNFGPGPFLASSTASLDESCTTKK